MSSPLRRIRRNMERPARKQRQRNQRAVSKVTQPLADGLRGLDVSGLLGVKLQEAKE